MRRIITVVGALFLSSATPVSAEPGREYTTPWFQVPGGNGSIEVQFQITHTSTSLTTRKTQ
jgi:hypothetical protein